MRTLKNRILALICLLMATSNYAKVFAFTDNLDVQHRLYDNYRDAEGWRYRTRNNSSLAEERLPAEGNDAFLKMESGQDWSHLQTIFNKRICTKL